MWDTDTVAVKIVISKIVLAVDFWKQKALQKKKGRQTKNKKAENNTYMQGN